MSTIAVVGSGYVGLTTAASMASLGHHVVGIDVDAVKVAALRRAEVDIVEPGLVDLVRDGLRRGRLSFSTSHADAGRSEFVFLCVPTPPRSDGSADRTHLIEAVRSLSPHLAHGAVLIIKSTVPVGSAELVRGEVDRDDVAVVSNPEFLREGHAVEDCMRPERLVIGTHDQDAASKVFSLYRGIVTPVVVTDPQTAELTKYAANAFLATKISFMNEVAALCEHVGADVADVASGMGYDRRIGAEFLRAGPGWGGSCLPKDTRALRAMAAEVGEELAVVRAAIEVNERQMLRVVEKVRAAVPGGDLAGARVAVWGLAFKAGTADLRDSPSTRLIELLVAAGAEVSAHDPMVGAADLGHPEVVVAADAVKATAGAHVLVVMAEWDEYRWEDFSAVASAMAGRSVVDTRNHLSRDSVESAGLVHVGTGR